MILKRINFISLCDTPFYNQVTILKQKLHRFFPNLVFVKITFLDKASIFYYKLFINSAI